MIRGSAMTSVTIASDLKLVAGQRAIRARSNDESRFWHTTWTQLAPIDASRLLRSRAPDIDASMIFVSDHGERPYALAPGRADRIPFLLWLPADRLREWRLDATCIRSRSAQQPVLHDNFYPMVLGLMGVRTSLYDPARDVLATCSRRAGAREPSHGTHGTLVAPQDPCGCSGLLRGCSARGGRADRKGFDQRPDREHGPRGRQNHAAARAYSLPAPWVPG